MNELNGQRSVIVTGASSGIGRATAISLANRGFRVFAGVRKEEDGRALEEEQGENIEHVLLDVCDSESISKAVEEIGDRLAKEGCGLHGLVNNAGIGVGGPLEYLPLGQLRHQFEVNVFGVVAVTQAFCSYLRKARGRVVNISSVSGFVATPFLGPYCASKFALEALSDSLRLELRPQGVKVSIIEPGCIATAIWEKSRASADRMRAELPDEARALYGARLSAVRALVRKSEAGAIPADAVVVKIVHALTSSRPKARYLVGHDARISRWIARIPTGLRDWMFDSFLSRKEGEG